MNAFKMNKYGYSKDPKLAIAPEGWFSDEEEELPAAKKQKLAKLRFKSLSTAKEVESYSDKKLPRNTAYPTTWALRNYTDWADHKNSLAQEETVPKELFSTGSCEQLNKWLSFFVLETRNSKGERYPPKTIYQLLTFSAKTHEDFEPQRSQRPGQI